MADDHHFAKQMEVGNSGVEVRQILAVSERIGMEFPDSLKAYLANVNGGRLRMPLCRVSFNGDRLTIQTAFIRKMFSLDEIEKTFLHYDDRIPRKYLPIAEDLGGNLVLMCISSGAVMFWEHDADDSEELGFISRDFASYFGALFTE